PPELYTLSLHDALPIFDPIWWTPNEWSKRCSPWSKRGSPVGSVGAFTPEFKAGAVRLVLDEERTVSSVARDLDLNASSVGQWVRSEEHTSELQSLRHLV